MTMLCGFSINLLNKSQSKDVPVIVNPVILLWVAYPDHRNKGSFALKLFNFLLRSGNWMFVKIVHSLGESNTSVVPNA